MYSLPWLIGGDFNEILHLSEKLGGANRCSSSMQAFGDAINQCGLRDIGFNDHVSRGRIISCTQMLSMRDWTDVLLMD